MLTPCFVLAKQERGGLRQPGELPGEEELTATGEEDRLADAKRAHQTMQVELSMALEAGPGAADAPGTPSAKDSFMLTGDDEDDDDDDNAGSLPAAALH